MLQALTPASIEPGTSYAKPFPFVCDDGRTYWLKGSAQRGLVVELVAGRLASLVKAGPLARVVNVSPTALPEDGQLNHLQGLVVGVENLEGVENARDLGALLANQKFNPQSVDAQSRARVIVFQTWLGVGDQQVLVDLRRGKVYSIDHGDCIADPANPLAAFHVVITDIPGITADVGRNNDMVMTAVARIEAITNNDIMGAIAQVPSGHAWDSDVDRRLQMGRWLAVRRDNLRGVMASWVSM